MPAAAEYVVVQVVAVPGVTASFDAARNPYFTFLESDHASCSSRTHRGRISHSLTDYRRVRRSGEV